MRIHDGVDYECDHCDIEGTTQSHLKPQSKVKRHKLSIHNEVKYECGQCDLRGKNRVIWANTKWLLIMV